MWGTLCLLIVLLGLLILGILGCIFGQTMWYGQIIYCLWLCYFIAICALFLYREQKHNATSGSLFKLHDRLLAMGHGADRSKAASSHAKAAVEPSGSTLADEDKML